MPFLEAHLPMTEALHRWGDTPHAFLEGEEGRALRREDAVKMADMGLGDLPVGVIAVPVDSPLLQPPPVPVVVDIRHQLTRFLPGYLVAALYELQSLVRNGGFRAYLVGGIPRDLILSQERHRERQWILRDVDMTVEGDALEVTAYFAAHSRNFVTEAQFPEFGTSRMRYKDLFSLDIASTRRERYPHCGALPEVTARGVPLQEDVARRDFTLNTLALSVHELGQLIDNTGGIRDIAARRIVALHPVSFFEDPSRILRAFKFATRFDATFSPETQQILQTFLQQAFLQVATGEAAPLYRGGGERIKLELKGFLSLEETAAKRRLMALFLAWDAFRLVDAALPHEALAAARRHVETFQARWPLAVQHLGAWLEAPDCLWLAYLCAFFYACPAEALELALQRLGLTKREREAVVDIRRLAAREKLQDLPLEALRVYPYFHGVCFPAAVTAALLSEEPERALEALALYKNQWEGVRVSLNGYDLMGLGVPAGEAVGRLLQALLQEKLQGKLPTRLDEVAYVQGLLGHTPLDTQTPLGEATETGEF